jgi:hypothetical protein
MTPQPSTSPTQAEPQAPAGDLNITKPADPQSEPNNDRKDALKSKRKSRRKSKKRGKRKPASEQSDAPHPSGAPEEEEKPKRPPQIHADEEIHGMLDALLAMYPGMTKTGIVKLALRHMCDNIAYLPPVNLARLDGPTLRILAGTSTNAEVSAKRLIRSITKIKVNPELADRYMADLEVDVAAYRELRSTMMRLASIPMVPNLPDDVSVGIAVLEFHESECPHEEQQHGYRTCIEILKAYRPAEHNLPEDLQDPFSHEPQSEHDSE